MCHLALLENLPCNFVGGRSGCEESCLGTEGRRQTGHREQKDKKRQRRVLGISNIAPEEGVVGWAERAHRTWGMASEQPLMLAALFGMSGVGSSAV